jgi:hypothetical protein
MRLRTVALLAALGLPSVALAATVHIDQPTQGQTMRSGRVEVTVSLSPEFQPGRDGYVDLWVDGAYLMTLEGTKGMLNLHPGNHQIQARLVGLDHQPLRIAANSTRITITVPYVSP